ncbi:unnamed protein product, partial [Ectocarpus sp. 13 AM-2016]
MADLPGQDTVLPEESFHVEEGSGGGDRTQSDGAVRDEHVATFLDEDGFADDDREGDAVLGDDPEGGAGGVSSTGDGLAGGSDDAFIVWPTVEINSDGPSASGDVSTAGVGTLVDGRDSATDFGSADGAIAVAAEGGEASAVSAGDDEASGVLPTEGDAGVDEGETRPRWSWLPWRRHQPADVDEDPVTSFAPAGDDAAPAGSDLPDDVVGVGDDLTAAALEQVVSTPSSLPESIMLASESITDSGEDVSTGEAGDVSDGDDPEPVTSDLNLGPHVNLEGGGRTSDVADPPGQDGTLFDESSHMEEGLADDVIISSAAGDGEASALSISYDEVLDVSSTDGDAGIDEGETRPRRSWLPWRRHRPADVKEDPVISSAPVGDDTALAGSDLPEDVVHLGDGDNAALEQGMLRLSEIALLASESITDGGKDVSTGEAGDVSDGDDRDAVIGDTGPGLHVNLEEGRISDLADLPGKDTVLQEESSHVEEGSAGGDGAWGGEDTQDGDLATIADEDVFADVTNEVDVVLGDDREGEAGGVSSMGAGLTGGDVDASSVSPAVNTDANDPATSGGVSTAEVGPLPGGDDVIDDSGLADDAVIAVRAEDGEALALSGGDDEASGVPITDGDAGAPAVQSILRRSWLPWRRHRPADVDEDPATNLAPAGDDADLAGPDLPGDVVGVVGDGDDAALEPAESTPLSLPESGLLASESVTNDEGSPDGTDAPDRGGGGKAGASELDEDAAAEYADGDAVPPAETSDVSDRDGPDAVAGDIGPGGGYETGPDDSGESSSVEIAAAHIGEASDITDPQEQVGALSEESHRMEEGFVWRDETGSVGDDKDGGVVMIPAEEGYADVGRESHAVLDYDPEGGTGGVTGVGAGLAGVEDDASSVSPAVETEADDSSTSGSDGDSAVPIDAEVSPSMDGRDDPADSGLTNGAIAAGAAGDGEASDVSSTDVDAGDDESETRSRRSWLPWRRNRPADFDEDPVTNFVPAGDDIALAGSDPPEDVVDMGDGDDAALEQAVLSLPESVLLASESITDGGEDVSTGEAGDVSDGDGPEPVTGDNAPGLHVNLDEGDTSDMADLPGQDGALSDESVNVEEGSDGGDRAQSDEAVEGGDVATAIDEDVFDDGSEGDVVLGDDPEDGASGVASMSASLAGGGDDVFTGSQTVETDADSRATSGSDSDSPITTAEVCALRGGYYATGDSGFGGMCVLATDGDASAVSTGDDEALGVSSSNGDADVDAGETRPRRSWFPWRRNRPADVDKDPVANLAPAGDDAGLAGPDLPDDVVDVGEDDGAALEQAVLSLPESVLLASRISTNGGDDVSAGEAGDVSDGDGQEPVTGDNGPGLHVSDGRGGTSDMADPPGQDGALYEEVSHMEEGSVGDDDARSGEDAKAWDETTTTDEDDFALDGDEGDAVLGDDPEGGAGGVTSIGDGLSGGDDDASSASPVVEASDDDSSTSGGEGDSAVSIDAEVSALIDGHDAAADSGAADGAVGAEGGESPAVSTAAVSTADHEALDDSLKDGDAGDDEGETRPRRSWLPWRRHRPADVDEDLVTSLAPAGDAAAFADPDHPEDVADVGDGDDASLWQAVSTPSSLSESVLLASESIRDGGEDVSNGEAGDVSDGDEREAIIGDSSPDSRGSDGGGDDVGDDLDDFGESTSVETFTAYSEEGARDTTDPPGPDGEFPDESSHVKEGPGAGHGAGNGEHAKAGDVATTTSDEDSFADDGSEGDVVLGDDPEGGAAGVMSIGAGLTGGDDDASGVLADVATKADDAATSGGYGDSAVSTAEVGDLPDGRDVIGELDLKRDPIGVSAIGSESSAVSNGDDEASDVSPTEGDADVDEGDTRPRRSWLPWRRHRPVDVEEDPVTNLEPAGDDAALAGPDLPDDVGDDLTAVALDQAVLSLPESKLLAFESITDGGEDVSAGEAGDVSDGDDQEAVAGDLAPTLHVNLEDGGTSDMADLPGQDTVLPEESSRIEEVSGGGHETQSDEAIAAGDVATTTDEDVFADDGSEGDVVLGDDPEGGAGGVTSMEAGEDGGDDDASGVSPVFETKADDAATSGGGGGAAAVSSAEVDTLAGGRDDAADSGLADDAIIGVVAEDGEASALSIGDDGTSDVAITDGDTGVDEGETRPRQSWLPWRRHRPADVDEDPLTNVAPAGDDADLADPDLLDDMVNVGDELTAAALEQAVLSSSESVLLASESITNGGEDVSTGEAGDASDGDAQDVVPDSRGSNGAGSIGDDLYDLSESAGVEAVTAHLEEGDASDMTDPPGQDRKEERSHVEEGPGAGHVPGSREDARAEDMTAVADDGVVADVGREGDVLLGDDREGFSEDAGVDDDDDGAPVVPVSGTQDASAVPDGYAHAAAEDFPTAHPTGETESAAPRRSRSPSQLAADDVDNAAVSQAAAAAAAAAATAAATAGDDVLELAATAVPVAAAAVGGAAAGSAPPRSWIRPKALRRLFKFGRAPRGGEEESQEEESPQMTTSAADGDGVGMPSQAETPTEGVSSASAKDVEEMVSLASDADGGVSPVSAEEAVDLATNGLTTTTSRVFGEDEDPSAAAPGTGGADGDGSDRDEAGTPALESPPSLEAGPSAPAASALPSTEVSSSRKREEESPGDNAATASLPTDPTTDAAAEGFSPMAAAGSSAREAAKPLAHAASLLSSGEAGDKASDTAGPRTPKHAGSTLDVDDGGDDRAPVCAEDAASGSPLSQGAAAEATPASALNEEGKLHGGVGVGAGAEATASEDGSESGDRVVPPAASSGEDLGEAAVVNAAASSEDGLDGGAGGDGAALEARTYAPGGADEGTSPGEDSSSSGEGGGQGGGGSEGGGGSGDGLEMGGEDDAAVVSAGATTAGTGEQEAPAGATLPLSEKDKDRVMEEEEEERERLRELVGDIASEEMSREGESEGISAESGGQGAENGEEESGADSKGWWARASDRRKEKAQEKARKKASDRAVAERKQDFKRLELSKVR